MKPQGSKPTSPLVTIHTLTIDIIDRTARGDDIAACWFEGDYDSPIRIPAGWYHIKVPRGEFDSRTKSAITCVWNRRKRTFVFYRDEAST